MLKNLQPILRWVPLVVLLLQGGVAGVAWADMARPILVAPVEALDILHTPWSRFPSPASQSSWESRAFESLRQEGWLWPELAWEGNQLHLRPGRRARLGRVEFTAGDSLLQQRFSEAANFRRDSAFRPAVWPDGLERGLRALGESGYPFAQVALLETTEETEAGLVHLRLLLAPGEKAVFGRLRLLNDTRTRPEVLWKLGGISSGEPYRQSRLDLMRRRLEARPAIGSLRDLRPVGGRPSEGVDLLLDLEQPARTNFIEAALGLSGEEGEEQRLSGRASLRLLDIAGTARQFEGQFLDDGQSRRRLELSYLEPVVLGSAFDLRVAARQQHEEASYDRLDGESALRLPVGGRKGIEVGVALDRSTFVGQSGRVRLRKRASFAFWASGARPAGRGAFGRLHSRVEAARVTESSSDSLQTSLDQSQILLDLEIEPAWALGPRASFELRSAWRSVEQEGAPVRSELLALGGAATVRGHREERWLGDRLAFGAAQLVLGPQGQGQGYAFGDLGWIRDAQGQQRWLKGYGIGLRSPLAGGALDLSLGFRGRPGFSDGQLHLRILQGF